MTTTACPRTSARATTRLRAHLSRVEPLAWQSIAVGFSSAVVLEVLLATGDVFAPERRWWVRACVVSFLVFAVLALVQGRVGQVSLRVQLLEAVVMIAALGTSTAVVGVLACCIMAVSSVLVNAATHLDRGELLGVAGLCAAAVATLLGAQGSSGTTLALTTMTVTLLGLVPATVLLGFRRRLEAAVLEAERQSRHDPLTGLLNRHGLAVAAPELVARAAAESRRVGVLVLDVDHFKRVNDLHGHVAGDVVLKGLATAVRQQARDGDLVARLGGEEVGVVVVCDGPDELSRLGECLRHAVAVAPTRPRVTVSVGGACSDPGPGDDPEQLVLRLVERADAPLYKVKDSGRDGVRVLSA